MKTDLLLVRHAISAPAAPGESDAARTLTAEGRTAFRACVRGLDVLGLKFERILHSPLLRAQETAELLLPLLESGGETVVTPALAEPPTEGLLSAVRGERVALVGHEPWMSELCAWLATGWPDDSPALRFKKGGVAWLRGPVEPGRMALRAFLPPSVLRELS
jgi:phosphohistidine phosphatase